jgi:hypothetical protein
MEKEVPPILPKALLLTHQVHPPRHAYLHCGLDALDVRLEKITRMHTV